MSSYKEDLRGHSEVFDSMLQLIPTGFYVMKDEDFIQSTKYFQNKKQKTSKEVHKEKRMKTKRRKLDPSINEEEPGSDNEGDRMPSDSEEDVAYEEPSLAVNIAEVKSLPLDELKEKLRTKIETMRAVRNPDGESKLKKRKSKDEATKAAKKPRVSQSEANEKKLSTVSINPAENGEQLQFNRLKIDSKQSKVKKKHGKKELEFMLDKAKKHQKEIEEVAKLDSEKAKKLLTEDKWKKAMTKAVGIKKKDDPVLLQRSIKKLDKQKQRSSKEWKDRKEAQDQVKVKKQVKREKNIKERVEKKKKHNILKRKSGGKGIKKKIIR